jgi:hypothetical protein
MRIHSRTVLDIETGAVLSDEVFEYSGPVALCDRSIAGQAGNNASAAGGTAGQYGSAAMGIGGPLTAQLQREAANPVGFTPDQINAQLVAGEQGAGGATAGITGAAGLNAMRTRNSGALSGVLDQAARTKQQALSQNALGVQNESAKLGLQRQSQAQGQLAGLYGTDVGGQMKALGLQNDDLSTQLAANRQGWLQNAESVANTISNAAGSFA